MIKFSKNYYLFIVGPSHAGTWKAKVVKIFEFSSYFVSFPAVQQSKSKFSKNQQYYALNTHPILNKSNK